MLRLLCPRQVAGESTLVIDHFMALLDRDRRTTVVSRVCPDALEYFRGSTTADKVGRDKWIFRSTGRAVAAKCLVVS